MLGFLKKKVTGSGKKGLDQLDDYELPCFSSTVLSLLAKLRDPSSTSDQIAADLEVDPGLHVRVLKTVNSVAFGLSHKVGNVRHAVNLLGRSRLESLVLSVAVKDSVDQFPIPEWLDMPRFWQMAARRAAVARGLALKLHPESQADSFTAGLLQDMGVPVLAMMKGDAYRDIYDQWLTDDNACLVSMETEMFDLDHAAVGGHMAAKWGFPETLVSAITSHHGDPGAGNSLSSTEAVSLLKDQPDATIIEALVQHTHKYFSLEENAVIQLVEEALLNSKELAKVLA
jgi:HD-like signal output (HDOD) protein